MRQGGGSRTVLRIAPQCRPVNSQAGASADAEVAVVKALVGNPGVKFAAEPLPEFMPGRWRQGSGAITWYLIDYLAGFMNLGISRAMPFRKINARPEILWDLIGLAAAAGFAELYLRFLEPGLSQALDGATWTIRFRSQVETLPWWALFSANLVATDFGSYWVHRLFHSKVLWPAHAWHHAPKCLYWISGMRGSLLHVVLLFAPATVVWSLFPIPDVDHAIAIYLLIHIGNQHLIHSNIRLPCASRLEWVFVTPRFHFVHHSSDMQRGNSNYGFIFSFWDRIFATYSDPDGVPRDDPLGLSYKAGNLRLLIGIPEGSGKPLNWRRRARG